MSFKDDKERVDRNLEIASDAIREGSRKLIDLVGRGVEAYNKLGDHCYRHTPEEAPNVKKAVYGFFTCTSGLLGMGHSVLRFLHNKAYGSEEKKE